MRIYLDACCVCRPFDDPAIERNRIEAEAVLSVLSLVEQQQAEFIASPVLNAELNQITDEERRDQATTLANLACEIGPMPDRGVTETMIARGFKPLDAMHIAAAIKSQCNVFLTTDDSTVTNR